MKPQLTAVTIATKNLPLLKKFYTDVFNWTILMENPEIVILKLQETALSLCSETLYTEYTGIAPTGKSAYLTITLEWAGDVDHLFDELQDKGVTIVKMPAPTFWGGYSGFFTDPEGNLWEINSRM